MKTLEERVAALELHVFGPQTPEIKPPAGPPAPTQPTTPPATSGVDPALGERYGSRAALLGHLALINYQHLVTIDGETVRMGTLPEQKYFTSAIGLITRTPQPIPVTGTSPTPPGTNVVQVGEGESSFVDPSKWPPEGWAWWSAQGYAIQSRIDQVKWRRHVQGYGPGGEFYNPDRPKIRPPNI